MSQEPRKEIRVGMSLLPVIACVLMICGLFLFGFAVQCAQKATNPINSQGAAK